MTEEDKPVDKGGRPKITLDELVEGKTWEEAKAMILEAGGIGMADIVIRHKILNISNNLWTRLMEEQGEFWETVQEARALCEAWWTDVPRNHLENKDLNTTLFAKFMANKFNWREKHDHTTKDQPITGIEVSFVGKKESKDE